MNYFPESLGMYCLIVVVGTIFMCMAESKVILGNFLLRRSITAIFLACSYLLLVSWYLPNQYPALNEVMATPRARAYPVLPVSFGSFMVIFPELLGPYETKISVTSFFGWALIVVPLIFSVLATLWVVI